MSHYGHLSTIEREKIDEGFCLRKSLRSIAREIVSGVVLIAMGLMLLTDTFGFYAALFDPY